MALKGRAGSQSGLDLDPVDPVLFQGEWRASSGWKRSRLITTNKHPNDQLVVLTTRRHACIQRLESPERTWRKPVRLKIVPQWLVATKASNAPHRSTQLALTLLSRCTLASLHGLENLHLRPYLAPTSQPELQMTCPPTYASHYPRLPTNQAPLQSATDVVPWHARVSHGWLRHLPRASRGR
jgi:hypothetical protein